MAFVTFAFATSNLSETISIPVNLLLRLTGSDLDNALVKELEEKNHIANYIKKPIQIDDLIE